MDPHSAVTAVEAAAAAPPVDRRTTAMSVSQMIYSTDLLEYCAEVLVLEVLTLQCFHSLLIQNFLPLQILCFYSIIIW